MAGTQRVLSIPILTWQTTWCLSPGCPWLLSGVGWLVDHFNAKADEAELRISHFQNPHYFFELRTLQYSLLQPGSMGFQLSVLPLMHP